jgi:hypothetical protein
MIEEARYLDTPVVLIAGNRVVFKNAAVDDLLEDYSQAVILGAAYLDEGPIIQARTRKLKQEDEALQDRRYDRALKRGVRRLRSLLNEDL